MRMSTSCEMLSERCASSTQVRGVAGFVAPGGEAQRVARRGNALLQVFLGGAGEPDVHERIGDLVKRRLDRLRMSGDGFLAAGDVRIDLGIQPPRRQDRQRKREPERPDASAAVDEIREIAALAAEISGERDARKERGLGDADLRVGRDSNCSHPRQSAEDTASTHYTIALVCK